MHRKFYSQKIVGDGRGEGWSEMPKRINKWKIPQPSGKHSWTLMWAWYQILQNQMQDN